MLRKLCLVFVCLFPSLALAEIDYTCLTKCKNDGKITQLCMQQCSYAKPAPVYVPEKGEGNAHKEFTAPVAIGSLIVPNQVKEVAPDASAVAKTVSGSIKPNSPHCLQDCMMQKYQYSFCQQHCAVSK